MRVFLLVTKDKYELPLMVCDSAEELARRVGVSPQTVWTCIWKASKAGRNCKYKVVDIDDVDDADTDGLENRPEN